MPTTHVVVALLALLLAGPATFGAGGVGAPLDGPFLLPHPPITIRSDSGFLLPGSGVVSGSGTAEDPYLIARWIIPATQAAVVALFDTTAHVVVEDVASAPGSIFFSGAVIVNASNVTLRRVAFHGTHNDGIFLRNASDVVIDGASLTKGPNGDGLFPPFANLYLMDSERVHVRGVSATGGDLPLGVRNLRDALIEDSTFASGAASGGMGGFDNVTFRNVTFRDFDLTYQRANRDVAFLDGRILGRAKLGVLTSSSSQPPSMDGLLVCGTTFASTTFRGALEVEGATGATVVGNTFLDNRVPLEVRRSTDVLVERNAFSGSTSAGAGLARYHVVARHNSFEETKRVFLGAGTLAGENWWGSPDGPSLDGPGSGTPVRAEAANATFTPWLTAPPDLTTDCDAEVEAWRS